MKPQKKPAETGLADNGSLAVSGMICTLISGILFGTMPLMAKTAYSMGSNAYTVAFGRFLTGAIFSGLFLKIRYGSVLDITKEQVKKIAILSIFFAMMPCLLYSSYQYIDSGLATTLHFTYPVVVMLISALVFKNGISRTNVLCILLCAAGMIFLYQSGGNTSLKGMALAGASGVVYAVYITLVDRSGLKELPVLKIIFWLSLFSAAAVLVFSFPQHLLLLKLPPAVWLPYTGLGLVAMVIAASLFQIGIMRCGGVRSAMLSTIEPVTGVVIGVLVYGEKMGIRTVVGITLILLSVIILVFPQIVKPNGQKSEKI